MAGRGGCFGHLSLIPVFILVVYSSSSFVYSSSSFVFSSSSFLSTDTTYMYLRDSFVRQLSRLLCFLSFVLQSSSSFLFVYFSFRSPGLIHCHLQPPSIVFVICFCHFFLSGFVDAVREWSELVTVNRRCIRLHR